MIKLLLANSEGEAHGTIQRFKSDIEIIDNERIIVTKFTSFGKKCHIPPTLNNRFTGRFGT